MKGIIKLMLILAVGFASTFLVLNMSGLLSAEKISNWLETAQNSSPILIGGIVISLLFADLFVAMPTLTIMLLSGFFLGPLIGALCSITGLVLAGFTGYGISNRFGDRFVKVLIKDSKERESTQRAFRRYGAGTILLSRAMPILPEVSACMAGLTKMPKQRFVIAWLLSTVPYATLASYAGSISTVNNPKPAILTAIGLTMFLWLSWAIYRRFFMQEQSQHIAG